MGLENKAKILVVDDELQIVSVLKEFLSLKGYSVNGSLSAEEALDRLSKEKYDCVLLDIMMPGMKGTEAAKIIKKNYPSTKVIIMTGFLNFADSLRRENILEAVFKKPFSLEELANKLSSIIDSKPAEPQEAKQKGKIQARVLIIKAKLLFLEPSSKTFNFLNGYFKQLSAQGKDYELDVCEKEEGVSDKLISFAPDLLLINASMSRDYKSKILPSITSANFAPKEVIIYILSDTQNQENPELQKLSTAIETSCLKNGLIEIKWIEI